MENFSDKAEQIALFCRLNMNTKGKLPIRSSEMGMLIYLCKVGVDRSPMGIARFFNVSKAMATNMVTSMYKQGYIEKKPSSDDRRSSLIIPTRKGEILVEDTYDEYNKIIRLLRGKMGEGNFNMLLELLEKANVILLEGKNNG